MTRETEDLLCEVLLELLIYLKRENEARARQNIETELAEIRQRRWGYPIARRRRRN